MNGKEIIAHNLLVLLGLLMDKGGRPNTIEHSYGSGLINPEVLTLSGVDPTTIGVCEDGRIEVCDADHNIVFSAYDAKTVLGFYFV